MDTPKINFSTTPETTKTIQQAAKEIIELTAKVVAGEIEPKEAKAVQKRIDEMVLGTINDPGDREKLREMFDSQTKKHEARLASNIGNLPFSPWAALVMAYKLYDDLLNDDGVDSN